ncbi:hypothetical protein JCM11251_004361 [Rhodosporidiobolus azoricus]
MSADFSTFSEPIASTSRAVFALLYKEPDVNEVEEEADVYTDPVRAELYQHAWTECNDRIQTTLSTLHDASLDQIVAFTHASREAAKGSLYTALSGRVPLRTGLIVGASPGSSSLLYSSLTRLLSTANPTSSTSASEPCIVSRLSSRDCSNIKNALRSLIGGFVGSRANVEVVDEDEEEDEMDFHVGAAGGGARTLKSQLLVPEDMRNLTAWYESRFGKNNSDTAPTLTILLEDLEAMDGKVLTQLLENLALYTSTLPLVLLIGIATTPDALYSLVPRKTANKLDAQSFFVDPGVGAFNALVRGVFINSLPPLSLSPKTYTDLYCTFEDVHHSIDATISLIQYLYMRHFMTSPLASLTLPRNQEEPLSMEEATALGSLPSLSLATIQPGTDPSSVLSSARTRLEDWSITRSVAFEALLVMMEFWEKRRPVEAVLGMVLGDEGEAAQGGAGAGKALDKVVESLCGLVLQASSSKLLLFLKHLTSRLALFLPSHSSSSSSSSLLDFLTSQLASLEPILSLPRPPNRANLINTNLAGSLPLAGFGVAAVGGQGGLVEADKQFSKLAKETAEGLKARLREAFRPVKEVVPAWEVWFTEDSSAMKRFHPTPLPSLLSLLKKLDPLPSSISNGASPPSLPLDLAVAYRTYTETHPSGRLANLGEWFAAWELGAAEEEEEEEEEDGGLDGGGRRNGESAGKATGKGKKRARDEEDEDEDEAEEEEEDEGPARRKQARFLRCVGDLAHIGFLHPTTYKPEHVLKSVY